MKNDRSEYQKEYRKKNSEALKIKRVKYLDDNKEMIKNGKKRYYEENKDYVLNKNKENYNRNIEKYRVTKKDYVNKRRNEDPFYKMKFNIRSLIRNSLKRKFTDKSKKTIDILGCSFEEFKVHLENKFDDKMNWENYGIYWEIDHIIPISISQTEEELYELNHYSNLRPLYWLDNLHKSDNYFLSYFSLNSL